MTETRAIVERALKRIGVVAQGQALSGEMLSKGLQALNDEMHQWSRRGLSYIHTTLADSDQFPLGEEHEGGVAAILALRLTDDYAPEADTPQLRVDRRRGWAILVNEYWEDDPPESDLPRQSSRR